MQKISQILNDWFVEATPRFQFISLLACIFSILLVLILFLKPTAINVKTMPVQKISEQKPPNVIFILVDALAANDMSMFGYHLPTTTNLDKITNTWTVFSNAQSPLTCTVAALPTLMSGRYTYINNFRYYGDQISTQPGWFSLPNALEQTGYQTRWSGYHSPGFYHMGQVFQDNVCRSNDRFFIALSHSWFLPRAISKNYFPFVPFTLSKIDYVGEMQTDFGQCAELTPLEKLIQELHKSSPFFIYYHYNGAHGFPYPSGDALGKFLPISDGLISETDQRKVYGSYNPEDQLVVDKLRLRYDEGIADQDQRLANFIETLKQQGLYDSSMIVITSDHGQNFSNGYSSHCTPLVAYAEAHVPLLVKYPYQTEGQWFDFLVSTIDIAPTILDVAGLKYDENWFDGISLLKQVENIDNNRIVFTRRYDYYYKQIPSEIAATDGRYRLVMRGEKLLLFDLETDPIEEIDILNQNGDEQDLEVLRLQQALENYRQRAKHLLDGRGILSAPLLGSPTTSQP